MKVLILLTARGHGGVETHVYHLARALVEDGNEVLLTSFTELSLDPEWEGELVSKGVHFVPPPENAARQGSILRVWSARNALRRRLRGVRFDCVVGQGHGGTLSLMRAFLEPRGSLLWHEYWHGLPTHGDTYAGFEVPEPRRFGWRMRRVLAAVDGVVTGCERARRNLRNVQHYTGPLLVIPPLTAVHGLAAGGGRAGNSGGILKIVFVGRLGFGKGAETLLELWPSLDIQPAELHFHGPIAAGRSRDIVKRFEGCGGVHFHGPFEHSLLKSILQEADMGVMLSIEEGFGLVACEYMAAGLPFVMTDCGAAEEFTIDNPDAYRVPVSESGVKTGLETMARRIRAGQTSRKRLQAWFGARFDWKQIIALHCQAVRTPPVQWSREGASCESNA